MATDYLIRELPEGERPRERLLRQGGSSLADSELLAVLLRTGRRGVSAIQMAMDVLRENGGLSGLLTATPHSLRRNGLGNAKAIGLAQRRHASSRRPSALGLPRSPEKRRHYRRVAGPKKAKRRPGR